jgi:hypothetical protein
MLYEWVGCAYAWSFFSCICIASFPSHEKVSYLLQLDNLIEGFGGFQLSPYAGVHECGIGGTVVCYSRNLSIFLTSFLTMFFNQNTTYRKVVLVWLLDVDTFSSLESLLFLSNYNPSLQRVSLTRGNYGFVVSRTSHFLAFQDMLL